MTAFAAFGHSISVAGLPIWVGFCRSARRDAAVHEARIGHFRTLAYLTVGPLEAASADTPRSDSHRASGVIARAHVTNALRPHSGAGCD